MRFLIAIEEEVSLSEQNNCPLPGSIEARVMHTSVLLLAVTWLLLPLRSHALTLTYWLDDNCGDDVKRAINEARTGSSRMLTRMNTQAEHPYMYWLQEAIHRGGTPEISNYIFSTYKSKYQMDWNMEQITRIRVDSIQVLSAVSRIKICGR